VKVRAESTINIVSIPLFFPTMHTHRVHAAYMTNVASSYNMFTSYYNSHSFSFKVTDVFYFEKSL